MRLLSLGLILILGCAHATAPLSRDQAVEEVRQAEIAFARAFNDQDTARFRGMMTEDAHFLGPQRTLSGKAEVMGVWENLIRDNQFSWAPERVVVNADGTIGLSTGPVRNRSGEVIGQFSSIWQRQPDGSWKVLFDGPGCFCEN